jgi:hypothetical protein
MTELFQGLTSNEKKPDKISTVEPLDLKETENDPEKKRAKENLEGTLAGLQRNKPNDVLFFLVEANIPSLRDTVRDYQHICFSIAARMILENVKRDGRGGRSMVIFNANNVIDPYVADYHKVWDDLSDKWKKVGDLLIWFRAAQRADQGAFNDNEEYLYGASTLYRMIGMETEAEELDRKKNDIHHIQYEYCEDGEYVGPAIKAFLENVKAEDLISEEEAERIRVEAIGKIEELLKELEK